MPPAMRGELVHVVELNGTNAYRTYCGKVFYKNEMPWWPLGTLVDDAPTCMGCIVESQEAR